MPSRSDDGGARRPLVRRGPPDAGVAVGPPASGVLRRQRAVSPSFVVVVGRGPLGGARAVLSLPAKAARARVDVLDG